MNIVILNGSPKGEVSVTMQYVEYLGRRFPQHEFSIHHVARRIHRIERDEAVFNEVIEAVRAADGIIWAFPLYIMLVCSQYKRFIELIGERKVWDAFSKKYATSLSTSINFYDHTAHGYVRSICEDAGMQFVGSYSANMTDLQEEQEGERLTLFAADFFDAMETGRVTARRYAPLSDAANELSITSPDCKIDTHGKRILILTDESDAGIHGRNLSAMTEYLQRLWGGNVKKVNLLDIDIRGGCLGCLKCGQNYQCAYTDGFSEFYRSEVLTADIIVYAGQVVDRQLSSLWRKFLDRSFFNTHTPVLTGKQIMYVVSGPLGQLPGMRQVYEAWGEIQEANLVGFVGDDMPVNLVFPALKGLAEQAVRFSVQRYIHPRTFLGIGGMKIFRDDIFGHLRIAFPADFNAYRKRKYFDFPTVNLRRRAMLYTLSLFLKLRFAREAFVKNIKTGMIRRLKRVALSAQPYKGVSL